MKGSTQAAVTRTLFAIALAFLGLCVLLAIDALPKLINPGVQEIVFLVCLALGGTSLFWIHGLLAAHFKGLERLRGDVVTMASKARAVIPPEGAEGGGAELRQIHQAVGNLADYVKRTAGLPDSRLEAILKSVTQPLVVTSETGVTALINGSGKSLLGDMGVAIGADLSAAFDQDSLDTALAATTQPNHAATVAFKTRRGAGMDASLVRMEDGGFVVNFPQPASVAPLGLDYDLEVLDPLPDPGPVAAETPLADLPMLVLDTETTGLDVKEDRVVSIGAVRVVGQHVFTQVTFNQLCNPGRPVPPAATRIHGITDDMLADAPPFQDVWPDCAALLESTVLTGYNIPFDIAMLRRECHLAGIEWQEPPFLDILMLAVALIDELPNDNLEGLTAYLGVEIHDRHSALGDSLVEAETLSCLIPRLKDKGIVTYGDAVAFSKKAKRIRAGQERSGWFDGQGETPKGEK